MQLLHGWDPAGVAADPRTMANGQDFHVCVVALVFLVVVTGWISTFTVAFDCVRHGVFVVAFDTVAFALRFEIGFTWPVSMRMKSTSFRRPLVTRPPAGRFADLCSRPRTSSSLGRTRSSLSDDSSPFVVDDVDARASDGGVASDIHKDQLVFCVSVTVAGVDCASSSSTLMLSSPNDASSESVASALGATSNEEQLRTVFLPRWFAETPPRARSIARVGVRVPVATCTFLFMPRSARARGSNAWRAVRSRARAIRSFPQATRRRKAKDYITDTRLDARGEGANREKYHTSLSSSLVFAASTSSGVAAARDDVAAAYAIDASA